MFALFLSIGKVCSSLPPLPLCKVLQHLRLEKSVWDWESQNYFDLA